MRRLTFGAGTMPAYLGGEPIFTWETVWYKEKCKKAEDFKSLSYNENNPWWTLHQNMMKEAMKLVKGDFYIPILDIVENLDILAALRGLEGLCFDTIDNPELVHEGVRIIDDAYFKYYDRCYEFLKDEEGYSAYQGSPLLGKGKTAKLQCDFSALISAEMFREFALPSIRKQCQALDYSLYHLDGPDAINHVPALMEIEELDAIQWVFGAGKPDGANREWYPIYDRVRDAGKGLQIFIRDGGPDDWAESAKSLVKRYGATGLFLVFPTFPDLKSAEEMAGLFG